MEQLKLYRVLLTSILNPQTEYAIVVLSDVTSYNVWISRFGEADVTMAWWTGSGYRATILVHFRLRMLVYGHRQYEDLKFAAYRCNFTSNGLVQFFNPTFLLI